MKRSNSNIKKEDRPSTAPAKEKEKDSLNRYFGSGTSNMNTNYRLPSPQIKPSSMVRGNTPNQENRKTNDILSSTMKYQRGNSLQSKPSNTRLDKSSSFKGLDSKFKLGKY